MSAFPSPAPRLHVRRSSLIIALGAVMALPVASTAQQGGNQRRSVRMDTARAAQLYVSDRHEDHPKADYARHMAEKARKIKPPQTRFGTDASLSV